MDWFRNLLFFFTKDLRHLSDAQVAKRYQHAGAIFGDAVSYIYMGECIGFEELLETWEKFEIEWAKRGFKTHSIDDFVSLGGYNVPLKDFGSRRGENEAPILHAKRYREAYLGKIEPAVTIEEMMQGPTTGTYVLPSTEDPPPKSGPFRT